jgi:UDP-N-acetylglucosamine:LPS N-acetylglucosamine transferase
MCAGTRRRYDSLCWLGKIKLVEVALTSGAPTVMAMASAGGHLVQLCRLMPAWDGCDVVVVTTNEAYRMEVESAAATYGLPRPRFAVVTEVNRWQRLRLIRTTIDIAVVLLRYRPQVLITTGAAPGYIALRLAALAGIRTVWVDSMANAEALSLSGEMAGRHADLWLTQWRHLSRANGPEYRGSVL